MLKIVVPVLALVFSFVAPQTPSPLPSASPSVSPSPSPSPSPTATPSPLVTPTPIATATALPTPLVLAPDAPPQILAVSMSSPELRSGETVTGTVITSTNVAAVEVRLHGRAKRLNRTDFGVWQLTFVVPKFPFFMRHRYTAQVIALNSAGMEAAQPVTFLLR